jgi:hypothetical protein
MSAVGPPVTLNAWPRFRRMRRQFRLVVANNLPLPEFQFAQQVVLFCSTLTKAFRRTRSQNVSVSEPRCTDMRIVTRVPKKAFAPFPRAILVRGRIPETLQSVTIDRVAYLSSDMNIALSERAAIEFFWPKLSPGASWCSMTTHSGDMRPRDNGRVREPV